MQVEMAQYLTGVFSLSGPLTLLLAIIIPSGAVLLLAIFIVLGVMCFIRSKNKVVLGEQVCFGGRGVLDVLWGQGILGRAGKLLGASYGSHLGARYTYNVHVHVYVYMLYVVPCISMGWGMQVHVHVC